MEKVAHSHDAIEPNDVAATNGIRRREAALKVTAVQKTSQLTHQCCQKSLKLTQFGVRNHNKAREIVRSGHENNDRRQRQESCYRRSTEPRPGHKWRCLECSYRIWQVYHQRTIHQLSTWGIPPSLDQESPSRRPLQELKIDLIRLQKYFLSVS